MSDLLDEMDDAPTGKTDENFDILDDLTEDSGVSWMPARDEDAPRGIVGKVIDVSTCKSDYEDANGSFERPFVSIRGERSVDAQGKKTEDDTEWSVRGLHTVLASEIRKADPKRGDTIAIKYLGERAAKVKGRKPTHVYKVMVQKAAA